MLYSGDLTATPQKQKCFLYATKALLIVLATVLALLSLVSLFNTIPTAPRMVAAGFSAPLLITKGGTYQGNWESRNTEVPAVEIRTSEPVIIEHSTIRGAGYLIKSWGYSTDITVRHTKGFGITPTPYSDYRKPRRFLTVDDFRNIEVENCYLDGTAGIYLAGEYLGDTTSAQRIKIRYNKVRNIDGRVYGGDKELVQFVQFNFRGEVAHAEIAWNEVINEPGASAVEDNINIYNSRGTSDSPIRIHNNYIQGAFPYPVSEEEYSGGGIIMDSPGTDSLTATAYVQVYDNQLVGLGNYCLGIAGGNHIEVHGNRAVVSATFANGSPYPFWTSGIWAADYYNMHNTYHNKIHHNDLGVVGRTGTWRNEIMDSTSLAADFYANTILPGSITKEREHREHAAWLAKLRRSQINIGPY